MGGSRYSDDAYYDRTRTRAAAGTPVFKHDDDIKTGKTVAAVNPKLDPKLVAGPGSPHAGRVMRESRDSDAHPDSLAIGVIVDETGSMGAIPVELQKKLPALMNLLIQRRFVAHPQILFGAVGDANSDQAPLQIGQFESGLEMDDCLSLLYLEGNGGGQQSETYELAHYFFLHHTSTDCLERRGKKGYLFTMGDEAPYSKIRKTQVEQLIGDVIPRDLTTKEVFTALQEKWNVFHIIVEQGSYPHSATIEAAWTSLLGERVLKLEDYNNVAELIALTIGLCEGTVDIDGASDALRSVGADANVVRTVTTALAPLVASGAMVRGSVKGDLPAVGGAGSTTRI